MRRLRTGRCCLLSFIIGSRCMFRSPDEKALNGIKCISHFDEKMGNTILMRFVRTSFQGRRRYILGAMLAVVLIAAVFITISRLGGTNRTVPAASTPTPGDTGLTKGPAPCTLA